jgi:hypothetical protein
MANAWNVQCIAANGGIPSLGAYADRYNCNTSLAIGTGPSYWVDDYSLCENVPGNDCTEAQFFGWQYAAVQIILDNVAETITLRMWAMLGRDGTMFEVGESVIGFAEIRSKAVSKGGMDPGDAALWNPSSLGHDIFFPSYNLTADNAGYLTHAKIKTGIAEPTLSTLTTMALDSVPDSTAWADYPMEWEDGYPVLEDVSGNERDLSVFGTLYEGVDFEDGIGGGVELAESATATELQTAQKSTTGAMSESVSSEDAQSALKITSGTQIETTTAEDEQAANKSTQSAILETASAVDTISAEVSGESSISESATATDTQGASKTTVSASVETCNALDTVDATKQAVAAIMEAMTAIDSATAESEDESNIIESASAQDAVSAILHGFASQVESATAQDTVSATISTTAAIVENANAVDVISAEDEYLIFNLGAFNFSETQSLGSFERSEYYDLGEFVCLEES